MPSPMPFGYSPRMTGSANIQFTRLSYNPAAARSSSDSLAGQVGAWLLAIPIDSAPAPRSACATLP